MNHIGELDGVLNKKNRDVISNKVPYAFFGVELDGKASHVSDGILQ